MWQQLGGDDVKIRTQPEVSVIALTHSHAQYQTSSLPR